MCLLCAGRGWTKEKRKQSNMHTHTHTHTPPTMNSPTEARVGRGCPGLVRDGKGILICQQQTCMQCGAVGPQPGMQPEKHLTGCFHGNITVSLEWKAAVVG
jgi:hypothetical protein